MARTPYKVIIWGPGIVGSILLKQAIERSDLELVGVLAYSEAKDGVDAGDLVGLTPAGVKVTIDQEAIFGLEADCVFFCPNVTAECEIDSEATNTVCRLLEGGKNVITSIGWWHPELHSSALAEKLEAACAAGRTSLHATGVNPGWLNERIVVGLTATCTNVSSIRVQEFNDNAQITSLSMMQAIGYGLPAGSKPWMENVGDRGYSESVALACHLLGLSVEGVEIEKNYIIADKDYELPAVSITKGSIAGLIYKYHAIVDGRRFFTLEEIWYIDRDTCPEAIEGDNGDFYTITIEGEPVSIKAKFELLASARENIRIREGDTVVPAYYATVVPMLQALPVTVGADPGLVYPFHFTNYVPDLREFASPIRHD